MVPITHGHASLRSYGNDEEGLELSVHSIEADGIFHEDIPLTLQELRDIHFVIGQYLKLYHDPNDKIHSVQS